MLHASGELEQASRTEQIVKMMVSSEGTKVAGLGTTDSTKQARNVG
jgi:hypothetical protein